MPGMKNAQGAPVACLQFFMTQVLPVPDVTQKSLVDVECARAHGAPRGKRGVQQNAYNKQLVLREEFVAVFLNLVAELQSLAASRCGKIFAG